MLDHENVGGADTTEGGALPGNDTGGTSGATNETVVPKADHDRALKDLHRFKTQAREANDRISALEETIESLKAQGLKENNDYKALYEATKAKLDEATQKATSLKENVIYSERYRAVLPALQKAGLSPEASKLVEYADLSLLEVEPRNGRFEVHGIDTFVEAFKIEHPYAFRSKAPATVNSGGATPPATRGTTDWTPAKLFAFEKECKAKGDMEPYRQAYKAYLAKRNSGTASV